MVNDLVLFNLLHLYDFWQCTCVRGYVCSG